MVRSRFFNHKMDSLSKQRIKPVKLMWTQNCRRKNKKGKADEAGKKRTKRAAKVQKAIVGMSLDDIKKKKAQRPELRVAAKEAALKEHKDRAKTAKAAAAKKGPKDKKANTPAAPKGKVTKGKM